MSLEQAQKLIAWDLVFERHTNCFRTRSILQNLVQFSHHSYTFQTMLMANDLAGKCTFWEAWKMRNPTSIHLHVLWYAKRYPSHMANGSEVTKARIRPMTGEIGQTGTMINHMVKGIGNLNGTPTIVTALRNIRRHHSHTHTRGDHKAIPSQLRNKRWCSLLVFLVMHYTRICFLCLALFCQYFNLLNLMLHIIIVNLFIVRSMYRPSDQVPGQYLHYFQHASWLMSSYRRVQQ